LILELPSTYLHVHKPHISTLWASFAPFFLWRVRQKLRCDNTTQFVWGKEDLTSILESFHSQTNFSSEKTLKSSKTQLFTHFNTFYLNLKHISLNLKTFPSSNFPWDWPTNSRLHLHFHPKLMKVISFSIETCFFTIQHEKFNLHIHVSNLIFLVKISFMHMKLVVWLAWQVC
jgi:hypothetical protein